MTYKGLADAIYMFNDFQGYAAIFADMETGFVWCVTSDHRVFFDHDKEQARLVCEKDGMLSKTLAAKELLELLQCLEEKRNEISE